ncbi:Arm DNA-binding domain-containing protein [Kitasatospora indigofera]|uniref:Arm DNA-binding domain-containing protein n=1 Tax=Kitasatospora indigofera TaxID=67307 RepID=UPI0036B53938
MWRLLEEAGHGSWTYCVDLAPEDGKRKTRWRGGFASRAEAAREMRAVLDGELRGVYEGSRVTVAGFLRQWLGVKKEEHAPNTYAGYEACVERDLIPAFGRYRLPDLRPKHITRSSSVVMRLRRATSCCATDRAGPGHSGSAA